MLDPPNNSSPLLLVIAGPTASGKSALALELARRMRGEIVNCDSMQMVRCLEIGTAKPSPAERSLVPHHLFDQVPPREFYSAGRYMKDARRVCREITLRGGVPIVVGGTGLYLRALLEGVFEGPGKVGELRKRLRGMAARRGSPRLHRWLRHLDPDSAARIQPTDQIRVIRALEVCLASGQPLSRQRSMRRPLSGYHLLKFGLRPGREALYARINQRVEEMFRRGLVEEVSALLARGIPPDCKGFEAIGYRQVISHLRGELELEEARELTSRETRRYAKRQLTWFRKEPEMIWIDAFGDQPHTLEIVLRKIEG